MHDIGVFGVQAFDKDGNSFTTLEGLAFQWTVTPQGKSTAASQPVLKKVSLDEIHDATIQVTPRMREMEAQGIETHLLPVHGVNTGSVQLTIALAEHDPKGKLRAEAAVIVTENLVLMPQRPAPLTIAPSAAFCFTLGALRGQRNDLKAGGAVARAELGSKSQLSQISMPCDEYKWRTENPAVASVEKDTGCVCGAGIGESAVRVEDQTLDSNAQGADLRVAVPGSARLHLSLLGEKSIVSQRAMTRRGITARQLVPGLLEEGAVSHVLLGQRYELNAFLMSTAREEMVVTDNTKFNFEWDKAALGTSDLQHHYITIEPAVAGRTTLNATLLPFVPPSHCGLYQYEPPTPVATTLQISVDKPLVVAPACPIRLPYDPDTPAHTFRMAAREGSGKYRWHTESGSPAVTTTTAGLLTVERPTATKDGETVALTDLLLPENRASCRVHATVPDKVSLTASKLAVPVGSSITVYSHASSEAAGGGIYHNCSSLPIKWSVEDETLFSTSALSGTPVTSSSPLGACSSLVIHAARPGVTTVRGTLSHRPEGSLVERVGRIEITAFLPLEVAMPASRRLLAVLGSRSPISFTGGPTGGVDTVEAGDISSVGIRRIAKPSAGSDFAWEVQCLAPHTQNLTLGITHPERPGMLFTAEVEYTCALPASLALQPAYEACPPESVIPAQASRRVLNRGTVEVRLLAFDANGRAFDDMDSISLGWEARSTLQQQRAVSHWALPAKRGARCRNPRREVRVHKRSGTVVIGALPGKIRWKHKGVHYEEAMPEAVYQKLQAHSARWSQLRPEATRSKQGRITGLIRLLRRKAREHAVFGIHPRLIGAVLELMLLPHVSITPKRVPVFRHPDNSVALAVDGGSGAMKITVSDDSLADHTVDYGEKVIVLRPKEIGLLRITVEDHGLHGSEPVHAEVLISEIAKVKLDVPQQVSLGSKVTGRIRVFASDGREFPRSQLSQMKFGWGDFEKRRLEISEPTKTGEVTVTGIHAGPAFIRTTATGLAGSPPKSDKALLNVFPRLELMPRHLHLLLGGEFQFQPFGGPSSGFKPHFSIGNASVAMMHPSEGFTKALALGDTTVSLTEYAINSDTVLARDTAKLTVMTLNENTALKISAPSSKLLVGAVMSAFLAGPGGESPFKYSFGREKGFQWAVSDPSVLAIVDNQGTEVPKSDGSYATKLRGLKPGKATVSCRMEWSPPCCRDGPTCSKEPCRRHPITVSAKATVVVVESLALDGPSVVVIPRNTRYLIRTNKPAESLLFEPTSKGVVTVDALGVVSSGDLLNSCHVVVRTASGEQSVAVTFHVRTISQLMLQMPLTQHQQADAKAVAMPLGATARVSVFVQDEVGQAFTAIRDFDDPEAHTAIQYLRDRTDVVNVNVGPDGASLSLSAMRQGLVSLRVWLTEAPSMDDYLRIAVDNIIEPGNAQVVVGGSVQYTVAVKNAANKSAAARNAWSSSNTGIATVDAAGGLASAVAFGTTHIHVTGVVKSYVELSAVRLSSVSFQKDTAAMVRNFDGKVYRAEVSVLDKAGVELFPSKPGIDHKLKVECSVGHSHALWAEAWSEWDVKARRHLCAIRPLLPNLGSEEDTRYIQKIGLHIAVQDAGGLDALRSNTSLLYMHAFRLSHHGTSHRAPERLQLKMVMGEIEILDLYGNAGQVVAVSNEASVISVRPLGMGIGGVPQFEIRRTGRMPKEAVVQVSFQCRVTGQREVAEVVMLDSSHWSWDQAGVLLMAHLEQGWAQVNTLLAGCVIAVALYFLLNGAESGAAGSFTPQDQPQQGTPGSGQRQTRSLRPQVGSPVRAVPDGGYGGVYGGSEQRSPVFQPTPGLGFDRGGRATIATPRRYDNYQ